MGRGKVRKRKGWEEEKAGRGTCGRKREEEERVGRKKGRKRKSGKRERLDRKR